MTTPVYWSNWCQYYYHDVADEAVTFDASFVKLREVTLTFDLPQKWISKLSIQKASVSFIGRNIWMWSHIKYIDPDTGLMNFKLHHPEIWVLILTSYFKKYCVMKFLKYYLIMLYLPL